MEILVSTDPPSGRREEIDRRMRGLLKDLVRTETGLSGGQRTALASVARAAIAHGRLEEFYSRVDYVPDVMKVLSLPRRQFHGRPA